VPGIGIDVVLVSIETLAVLLGPARILVFLPVFSTDLSSRPGRLAGLHILHFRHGYYAAWEPEQSSHQPSGRRERCSPSLPNAAKTLEQFLNETGLRKRLPEQPKRRAVGNAVLDAEPHKPRERQAVAHLILISVRRTDCKAIATPASET